MSRTAANGTGLASSVDDPRVVAAAEDYAELLRAGNNPDRAAFLARHADVADALAKCLDGLEFVHAAGDALSRSTADGPADGADLLLAGVPLGDYQLIRELGRGGMGIVYEAEQLSLGRRVALKVLPFAATMDAKQLQRFKNEARAAAGLRHEHIVPVYGVGCERGVHYYAMQLVEGASLAEVIADRRRASREGERPEDATVGFPPPADTPGAPETAPIAVWSTKVGDRALYRWAAEMVADAADALEHAHQLGVVHRDVKPANLLLDADGKVYVGDFGLARVGPDAGLTASGDVFGTLRYMAPEQALAKHNLVDHRADVYGLGCTLYELLSGRPAVAGHDKEEILHNLAFADPVVPRRFDKAIPAELETVALKCLAKDPAERYATAGGLADDLRRFLADRPIAARPPTVGQRLAKLARRHRGAVRTAMALLGVGAVALAGITVVVVRQRDEVRDALGQARASLATAEKERQRAKRAIDDMYTQVAERWLANQPRLQPLQREFLEKALAYYHEETAADDPSPAARLELARSYLRVGKIQTAFGDDARAEQALRRGADVLQALSAERPGAVAPRALLATVWTSLGHVRVRVGNNAGAEQTCRRAIAAFEQLGGGGVTAAEDRASLAICYCNLGHALERTSGPAAAEEAYRKAIGIQEQLAAQAPADPGRQIGVAAALQDLSAALYRAQQFQRAQEALERGIRHAELAVKRAPAEADYRAKLALLGMSLGVVCCRTGQQPVAEKALCAARDTQIRLAEEYPDFPQYRENLAQTYNVLGNVFDDTGRPREAEAAYRESIKIKDRLAADNPAMPYYRLDLVQALNNLTSLLTTSGRLPEAERINDETRGHAERLVRDFPGVSDHQKCLARVHQRRADIDLAVGRSADAAKEWERALQVSNDPDIRDGAAEFLAECPDPKYRDPGRAVDLARENTRLAPENFGYWETLGLAEYRAGRPAEAVAALERAGRVGSTEPLARLLLAMARWQAGDRDRARREYEAARGEIEKAGKPDEETRTLLAEAADLFGTTDGKNPTGTKAPRPSGGR